MTPTNKTSNKTNKTSNKTNNKENKDMNAQPKVTEVTETPETKEPVAEVKAPIPSADDILAELMQDHAEKGAGGSRAASWSLAELAILNNLAQLCLDGKLSKRGITAKVKELKLATGVCYPGIESNKTHSGFAKKLDEVYTELKDKQPEVSK